MNFKNYKIRPHFLILEVLIGIPLVFVRTVFLLLFLGFGILIQVLDRVIDNFQYFIPSGVVRKND
jgi:voltage-gated potassium channel Kch